MADTQLVKVEEQKTYSASYLIVSLIAGLVVGTLFSFVWFKTGPSQTLTVTGKNNAASPTTTGSTDTSVTATSSTSSVAVPSTVPPTSNDAAKLSIADQAAGLKVIIAHAQVGPDQWVAIRESKSGQVGNVLGAARFLGGATSGSIVLLRATVSGRTYFGLIYKDNGDHAFSLANDTPVRDASGNPLMVSFKAR